MFKAILVLAFVAAAMAQWTSCGTSADHLTISSLTINPNPIVRGDNVSITFSGNLDEQLTGGSVVVSVTYLGVSIFSHTYDLCSLSSDYPCPFPAGPMTLGVTENFPSYVPKGTYKGKVQVTDQSGAEVTCVMFAMGVSVDVEQVADLDKMAVRDEMIQAINSDPTSTWVAGHNKFSKMTRREARKLLGAKLLPKGSHKKYGVRFEAEAIPTSFDARTQWPTCIGAIRDQQQCGSCWAFSATEAFADRLCIATNGATNVVLSPEDLVSCDTTDYGCSGGYLVNAWQYMVSSGVVSDSCFPYTAGGGVAAPCATSCVDGSAWVKHHVASGSIIQPADITSIQTAIMTSGPVQAAFEVYEDFFSYTSGVYVHKSGALDGGHAIKIVGWGQTSTGVQYWIVANSWGTSWGMNGFFWIRRGVDECGIEDNVVAGAPAN